MAMADHEWREITENASYLPWAARYGIPWQIISKGWPVSKCSPCRGLVVSRDTPAGRGARRRRLGRVAAGLLAGAGLVAAGAEEASPAFHRAALIFPLEGWHNHGSCVVETPEGDLLACWFHGSGERTADDVKIEGARWRRATGMWSPRFTLADTPGYPDTNACLLVDPQRRLWLFWPTILANTWESALMKYRRSSDYAGDGPPRWETQEVLHVTPGEEFASTVVAFVGSMRPTLPADAAGAEKDQTAAQWLDAIEQRTADKLARRLGWFTRARPLVLDGTRLLVPLYSDGFSFSLMTWTDDWGATWHTGAPLIGAGNIQPSVVRRRDGSLYTLMRDNGPPPKRLLHSESFDRGETWSAVTDSALPNPGSGAEVIALRNGQWVLLNNSTETGRHRLVAHLSEDEGKTWPWRRDLEASAPGTGRYHYPSLLQAADGTLHATYSYHLEQGATVDDEGRPRAKAIKHAWFNEAWIQQGEPAEAEHGADEGW